MDDNIHVGGEQLFVGVQTRKAQVILDINLRLHLGVRVVAQLIAPGDQFVFENIGHGDKLDILVSGKTIDHRAAAAAAASDKPNPQGVHCVLGNARFAGQNGKTRRCRGCFREITPRHTVTRLFVHSTKPLC